MKLSNLESNLSTAAGASADETHARLLEASQSKSPDLTKVDPLLIGGQTPSVADTHFLKGDTFTGVLDIETDKDKPFTCSYDADTCKPNPQIEAEAKSLINNPAELAREIEKDFSVFDRDKDGSLAADETAQVIADPRASAHDKLLAEIMQRSWFSPNKGGEPEELTKANLKRIEILFDPAYVAANEKLLAQYQTPIAAIQGAVDNFDALSQHGLLSSDSIGDKENLNPQQRAIVEALSTPDIDSTLAQYRARFDGDQIPPDDWQFSKQELQDILHDEQKIQTGSTSQLLGLALDRTGQEWVNSQKFIGKGLIDSSILMPLILPIAALNEFEATVIDLPSQIHTNYETVKAEQSKDQASKPTK